MPEVLMDGSAIPRLNHRALVIRALKDDYARQEDRRVGGHTHLVKSEFLPIEHLAERLSDVLAQHLYVKVHWGDAPDAITEWNLSLTLWNNLLRCDGECRLFTDVGSVIGIVSQWWGRPPFLVLPGRFLSEKEQSGGWMRIIALWEQHAT